MLHFDTETRRQLARERQAQLRRNWEWVNPARPDLVESTRESSRRQWRLRLHWLKTRLRAASGLS